jgi:hypothetical protein
MAYDPFAAGGATPNSAAGQYQTGTGFSGDFIQGQAPTTLGFAGTGWTSSLSAFVSSINPPLNPSAPSFANFVYHRAEDSQFSYVDANNRSLVTTAGQVNLFRDSSSSTSGKQIARALNIGTSLPETMYVSMLTQVSSGAELNVQLTSSNLASDHRPFLFGINDTGNPYVIGTQVSGSTVTETIVTNNAVTVDPTQPHLLVAKISNNGTTLDSIELFVDPLLDNEALNSPLVTHAGGNFYVGSNAAWTIRDVFFDNLNPSGNMSVIMDEFRIGSTWESVTPNVEAAAVPEPGSLAIFAVAGLALAAALCWKRFPSRRSACVRGEL